MLPTRRDYRFNLRDTRIKNWHREGVEVTQFFNALSLFFPVGERFFINAVRQHRDQVNSAELKAAVTAFIGQEALHGREHDAFNTLLHDQVEIAKVLESSISRFLSVLQKVTPPAWQLSVTIALEHFTATFADKLLRDRNMLDGSDPQYRAMWLWHAIEEVEHKGVAYDVWKQSMGNGWNEYAVRVAGQLVTSVLFIALVSIFSAILLENELKGVKRINRFKHYSKMLNFLYGKGGFLRGSGGLMLDYFRRDFHPWQHDNKDMLKRVQEVERAANIPQLQMAA